MKVSPGDAVLVRTGRWARREKLGPWSVSQNAAGVDASVAPWFKARGVAFAGSDAALDVTPSLVEGNNLPVHTLFITAMGIHLLDNQDLEAVSAMAAKLNRWEFMLTIAPVPVTGGTGFPLNALATFEDCVETAFVAQPSVEPRPEPKHRRGTRRVSCGRGTFARDRPDAPRARGLSAVGPADERHRG